MIKKIVWALIGALLTGCQGSISGWQVVEAQKFCEVRGGIDHFTTFMRIWVICRDGSIHTPERAGGVK